MGSASVALLSALTPDPALRRKPPQGAVLLRDGVYVDREEWNQLPPWDRHRLRIRALRLQEPHLVLAQSSAALAVGLPVFGDPVEVTAIELPASARRIVGVNLRADFGERTIVETDLGPATSPVDTVIDISRTRNRAYALAVWDAAIRMGVRLPTLALRANTSVPVPSFGSFDWFIENANPASRSAGESMSRALLDWLGFPKPQIRRSVRTAKSSHVAGFLWPAERVIGNFTGHTRFDTTDENPLRALRLRKRSDDVLRRAGYTVVRWNQQDIVNPDKLAAKFKRTRLEPVHPRDEQLLAGYREAINVAMLSAAG